AVNPSNNNAVTVAEYPGAFHAWDRLMVPTSGLDPFGNEGSFFSTGILPTLQIILDVAHAYESRERVERFFRGNLGPRIDDSGDPPAYVIACPECGATGSKQLPGVPVGVAIDAWNRRFGVDH